jgi:membrane-associated phospholipid phosphatase
MSPGRLAFALVGFLVLVAAAGRAPVRAWDRDVTVTVQRVGRPLAVPAAAYVALADAEVLIPACLLAALALRRRDRRKARSAFRLALGLTGVSLLAVGLKYLLPFPGPPRELRLLASRPGLSVPLLHSFPSGHTLRATLVAGTVLRRRPALAALLVGALMAALVLLGDHWATDVLGGAALGWACVEAGRGRGAGASRRESLAPGAPGEDP